jgi:hypothetical protein
MLTAAFQIVIDTNSFSFRFPAISFVCHITPKVIFPELGDVKFMDSLLFGLVNIQLLSN